MTITTYVPVGWTTTTSRSARNMDILESMYPDIISSIDAHTHPTIHYSESQSDAFFFGSGLETGLDAEYIDSVSLSTIMGSLAPNGFHLVWSGNDNDFSNGYLISDTRWHIADGGTYNGIYTTDMRGYFPRSSLVNNGTGSGGSSTVTMSGTVTISNHTLSISELPAHYHGMVDDYWQFNGLDFSYGSGHPVIYTTVYVNPPATSYTGGGQSHDHSTMSQNLTTQDKTPLYTALYFICKVLT